MREFLSTLKGDDMDRIVGFTNPRGETPGNFDLLCYDAGKRGTPPW